MAASAKVEGTHAALASLEPFHRVILQWDFFEDIRDDRVPLAVQKQREEQKRQTEAEGGAGAEGQPARTDDVVPKRDKLVEGYKKEGKLVEALPIRFASVQEYIQAFEPLFMIETRATIDRAKTLEMRISEEACIITCRVDGQVVRLELERKLGPQSRIDEYSHSDLVLLSKNESFKEPCATHLLALVEGSSTSGILQVKAALQSDDGDNTRFVNVARALNNPRDPWFVSRIMNMATCHREYQALHSVPHLMILNDLLRSDPSVGGGNPTADVVGESLEAAAAEAKNWRQQQRDLKLRQRLTVPGGLLQALRRRYNVSQVKAFEECLKPSGVTLIQGPPGTGKTSTIIAVLSVLLCAKAGGQRSSSSLIQQQQQGAKPKGGAKAKEAAQKEKKRRVGDPALSPKALEQVADESSSGSGEDPATVAERMRVHWTHAQPWLFGPPEEDSDGDDLAHWLDRLSYRLEDPHKQNQFPTAHETDRVIVLEKVQHKEVPKRLLVCAPSNAAIDEIVRRIVSTGPEDGLFDQEGKRYKPRVVRVGPNLHPAIKDYSLEVLAQKRAKALASRAGAHGASALESLKLEILQEAQVVCATLSVCGARDLTIFPGDFDTVVVDEASQGVELSTLVPLKLGCRRLILVGDPKQLPATVFSQTAEDHGYDQSLFQRLEKAKHPVQRLTVQYRMHPLISRWPSCHFYEGNLKDAPQILDLVRKCPWHALPSFQPAVFFDMLSREEVSGTSLTNPDEALFVTHLVDLLMKMAPEEDVTSQLAVVTPYAEQVQLIRSRLRALLMVPASRPCPIDVNTVDGFQGREKEMVIFSSVRAHSRKSSIGFLADKRRMNVALTRARSNIFVIGCARHLVKNREWRSLIRHFEKNKALIRVSKPVVTFFPRFLREYYGRYPTAWKPPGGLAFLDASQETFRSLLQAEEEELERRERAAKKKKMEGGDVAGQAEATPRWVRGRGSGKGFCA
uniref:AAA+ ATPase domain-containing protein n=1 Tax=Chromera velia CCMP2878 TaxID=1169474 RepID=A0A0G4ICB4_9ALVE|eukprot:Cvel_13091.t1-p1 / transcript=Cvel_13091.t1 / gene=Cvel_13091 / organism=Chromera_velia_CCMP2878 / gene_product=Probable helicase MAGATAMA 3, putative / transcript_product=Probable helicase MAGATAMA 3, putative / location=Cvel_scaffold882:547-13806(-) / protein_length=966 / sequence_SO=supercontig / SO=protein_coding / is_pseudo=false